jgi:hypothetical protein
MTLSPIDLSVSSRKAIQTFTLDTKLMQSKQIPIEEGYLIMSQYGKTICAADSKMYHLISLSRQQSIPLFPYDVASMSPVALAIDKKESILVTSSAQGFGVGVFISSSGDPVRGTLQWPAVPISIGYCSPYIVALLNNASIQVHNIETQSLIQSLPLPTSLPPKFMCNAAFAMEVNSSDDTTGGTIQFLVGTTSDVFVVMMVPWDTQIQQLFDNEKVDEALVLLEQMKNNEQSEEQAVKRSYFYKKAGLHYISRAQFEKALVHLQKGQLDPKILLRLYSSIDYPLINEEGPNDGLPNLLSIDQIIERKVNESNGRSAKQAILQQKLEDSSLDLLIDYLKYAREFQEETEMIDTCLAQTLASKKATRELADLIHGHNNCDMELCVPSLIRNGYHYFASLLYKKNQKQDETLGIWIKLASGEVEDAEFPGIDSVLTYLHELSDREIVLKYASWILARDASRGVQIFINRKDVIFGVHEILSFLETYGTTAKQKYLEYLIFRDGLGEIAIQTDLAKLYLDEILRLAKNDMINELHSLYQIYDVRREKKFISFLSNRGDPLCKARLRFFDYVLRYAIDTDRLIDILELKQLGLHLEVIALKQQVYDTNAERDARRSTGGLCSSIK